MQTTKTPVASSCRTNLQVGDLVRYSPQQLERFPWGSRSTARHQIFIVIEVKENRFFESGICIEIASRWEVHPCEPQDLEETHNWNWEIPWWQLMYGLSKQCGWRYAVMKTGKIWWMWHK